MSAHKYELMFIADPELDERGLKTDIQVDGGVGLGNVKELMEAGANCHQGRRCCREHRHLGPSQACLRDRRQDRRQLRCGQLLR